MGERRILSHMRGPDAPRFKVSNKLSSMNLFGTNRSYASRLSNDPFSEEQPKSLKYSMVARGVHDRIEDYFQNSSTLQNFERSPKRSELESPLNAQQPSIEKSDKNLSQFSPSNRLQIDLEEEKEGTRPQLTYTNESALGEFSVRVSEYTKKTQRNSLI